MNETLKLVLAVAVAVGAGAATVLLVNTSQAPTPAPRAAATPSTAPAPVAATPTPPARPIAQQVDYPAAAAPPDWIDTLRTADEARGAAIAQQGHAGDVPPCGSCHGRDGQPISGSNVPRLSGQGAWYLTKQLHDYASGARQNAMMTTYARVLNPQEMADVALFWSRRAAPYAPPRDPDPALLARGRTLATLGDNTAMLPACSNCHGPTGQGGDPWIPYIAGQHVDYGVSALQDWVLGHRANDQAGVMRGILAGLSAEDRRAVSLYFATLDPPGAQPK